MVYIGCVLIIILSGMVGKCFSNKYVYRDKFYQFLINMCVYFKSSIGFNHSKIEQLFDDINEGLGKEFSKEIELLNLSEENILAVRQASIMLDLTKKDIEDIFYNNAKRLLIDRK